MPLRDLLSATLSSLCLGWLLCGSATKALAGEADLAYLHLPSGFKIHEYAQIPNARAMALGPRGTVFVGTRTEGRLFALRDQDGDGRADQLYELAAGLDMPTGVAFRDGALYVAESGRVLRYDGIEDHLADPPTPVEVTRVPAYRHHGWREIGFGPDDRLYLSMGAPCNVCESEDLGAIWRMRPDGSELEVFARGVRNSLGFAWHPRTGALWFTDNGRDLLGDDLPPDELNTAPRAGLDFGFPYCHGGDLADPEFGAKRPCHDFRPPVQRLGPHVASLGLVFYQGRQFPGQYRGQIIIAEHGSWNRSAPIGYRLTLVRLEGDRSLGYEPFVWGWLGEDGRVWGRPVDLLELPDGSLLISDDHAGRIYRLSYGALPSTAATLP